MCCGSEAREARRQLAAGRQRLPACLPRRPRFPRRGRLLRPGALREPQAALLLDEEESVLLAAAACGVASLAAADGVSPFVDYRGQRPGAVHRITPEDLPAPFATRSAVNDARIVPRPRDAWPQARTW